MKEMAMNAKKLVIAGILGTIVMLCAGTQKASADGYRRPVAYRPYYRTYWNRPYVYGYTYPAYTYPYAYTPAPAVYGYAPYCNTGVSVAVPGVGIRIGR
jgi:hypothetical protein